MPVGDPTVIDVQLDLIQTLGITAVLYYLGIVIKRIVPLLKKEFGEELIGVYDNIVGKLVRMMNRPEDWKV